MKQAFSIALIGISVLAIAWISRFDADAWGWQIRAVAWAAIGLGIAVGLILWFSISDPRSPATFRLDWFLPELRRVRAGERVNHRWLSRSLRSMLPASWRSRHETKQRGKLRRVLRRMGNSWLASPMRRVVQAMCLLLFLGSFFYVCWPYGARPADPGRSSLGWQFSDLDQQSGRLVFDGHQPDPWLSNGMRLFVGAKDLPPYVALQVVAVSSGRMEVAAEEDLPGELFDALFTQGQTWNFHERAPDAWPTHYADELDAKEWVPADLFLVLDPLLSLSTAIASRSWVWSLVCAAIILVVCLFVPRGFCGYLCPLGTTIDLFDWAIASRTDRFRVSGDGWWVHIKYYLLAATLIAASMGVLITGFVSAIPVITRACLFIGEPIQSGVVRGWHLVPAPNVGNVISITLFLMVLGLGFLRPRFWCKYVCPSGAVFSLGNLFRLTERKVESSCIHCNKCVEICPFDAIKPDFTTRGTDCTMCQSCGGVCPTHAIKFVERWNVVELKVENDPPTGETSLGRRGFLSLAGGSTAALVGGVTAAVATRALGAGAAVDPSSIQVRPPGSVPEEQFLQMCIRCGECFKACPNNVLQPEAFQQGLAGLWTPRVEANWAGCESSCNACGQVCPTGAIRALPIEEKRYARMGLAIVNEQTCLPFAAQEDCDLCVQECIAAGYRAIEYMQVGTEVDENGFPLAGTGRLAPVVLEDRCVGCGLCQTRCYAINVKERGVLSHSAIIIEAGEGKEDRIMTGSYRELRRGRRGNDSPIREEPPTSETQDSGDNAGAQESLPVLESESDNPFGL